MIAGATVAEPATAIAIAAEMGRVQLALNVTDLDEAIDFYSKLFQTEPAKRRPGYANFAIDEPPLKLVLLENPGHGGCTAPSTACRSPASIPWRRSRPTATM